MQESVFDPYQWEDYFLNVNREECENILTQCEPGTFIVRPSSQEGNYSLSLKCKPNNNGKEIFHCLIENVEVNGTPCFKALNRLFINMNEIISYYKINDLDYDTKLTTLPPKEIIKEVVCLFKFNGEEQDDLPFNEHENIKIMRKLEDKEDWGVAKNALGIIGMVPLNYVVDKRHYEPFIRVGKYKPQIQRAPELPAVAKVQYVRRPNIFNPEVLQLNKDTLVVVTEFLPSGECVVFERNNPENKGIMSPSQLQFSKIPFELSDIDKDSTLHRTRKPSNTKKVNSFS